MEIDISSIEKLRLARAFLVYENRDHEAVFVSSHLIKVFEDETGKHHAQIQPGSPLSKNALFNALNELANQQHEKDSLLPTTVLCATYSHLIWWKPPSREVVFFQSPEVGSLGKEISHPGLLFRIHEGKWSVFAVKGKKRPDRNTVLYHAPYFNVYDDGGICIGTAKVPKTIHYSGIPEWEKAFFLSGFTHPNGHVKKVSYERGIFAFWKDVLDGKFKTFPTRYLVSTGKTLGDFLA